MAVVTRYSRGRALVLVFLVFLLLLAVVLTVHKLSSTGLVVGVELVKKVGNNAGWHAVGKVLVENGKVVLFNSSLDRLR